MIRLVVIAILFSGLGAAAQTVTTTPAPGDKQAQAVQAATAIRRLSPLPDPDMTMRGVVEFQHGSKTAFCGEILGKEFPVRYSGFVRFISYDGQAMLDGPSSAFTEKEQFTRLWNSLCEPG